MRKAKHCGRRAMAMPEEAGALRRRDDADRDDEHRPGRRLHRDGEALDDVGAVPVVEDWAMLRTGR